MISPQKEDGKRIVGIFDSGVGGFSVLKEVRGITSASIIYFGDCARAPYGNRKKEEIVLFIKEIITKLQRKGVTHFISACNSMSVMTTDLVLKECNLPSENYIDVLRAFIRNCTFPKNAKVLLIGTEATIESGAYQEALSEKHVGVEEYSFRDLAKNVEESASYETFIETIKPCIFFAKNIKATHILYGCTHYPLVDDVFQRCAKEVNWNGVFINPAVFVGKEVIKWGLLGDGSTSFETSMHTRAFDTLASSYTQKRD